MAGNTFSDGGAQKQKAPTFACLQRLTGLILNLRPANERRRYKDTLSLIGWAQT